MTIGSMKRLLGAAAMAVAVAGCTTATPILIQGASLPTLQGRANTTAGYSGELTTDNNACRGSYAGTPGHPVVTLEISCKDGRRGVGTATLSDGVFVSGEVRLSDGSKLTVRQHAPATQ